MAEKIRVLLSEEEVNRRIKEIGEQISKEFEGEDVHLICVLRGSTFFTCELAKRITVPVTIDFMQVSSYVGEISSGVLKIKKDLSYDIEGKDVLIVEDIVDSGVTLSYLKQLLMGRGAASISIVTLLDKPARRRVDLKADYSCFEIPDEFVVGYGLDYDERYRNLPDIGVLSPRIYAGEE